MSKVDRFSLEERYNYQIRKVIYDRDADSDIELNNIYPIIDQLNKLDKQIADLEAKLAEKETDIIALDTENYSFKQQTDSLRQQLKDTEESYNNTMRYLNKTRSELLNLPKKIVEEIRSKCCVEDKCKDGSFVLGINEKDLDTILKEYQK